jgi:hypothetical protein
MSITSAGAMGAVCVALGIVIGWRIYRPFMLLACVSLAGVIGGGITAGIWLNPDWGIIFLVWQLTLFSSLALILPHAAKFSTGKE